MLLSPFSAYSYPPLHHNGKGSIAGFLKLILVVLADNFFNYSLLSVSALSSEVGTV